MNEKNCSDIELVKMTLKDKEYFIHLMERYEEKLMRYISRLTNLGKEISEDILQEVFIKVYRNLYSYDQEQKFSNWIYRIAHNEAINHINKHKKQKTISLEKNNDESLNLIDILKDDIDIKEEARLNELKKNVRSLLMKMPKKYKDVLILKFLEDKDYKEISYILKKPMGTVATLINRAKSKFKKLALNNNLK